MASDAPSLPIHWYAQGTPVPDIDARSPDAGSILETDEDDVNEFELPWRCCRVPVAELEDVLHRQKGLPLTVELDDDGLPPGLPREDAEEERARMAGIVAWFRECGGAALALDASPPLMRVAPAGGLTLLDGWHRLRAAVSCEALTEVSLLLAPLPSAAPEPPASSSPARRRAP